MNYDLIVDGHRFAGLHHASNLSADSLLGELERRAQKSGGVIYVNPDMHNRARINWERVATVQVVIHPDTGP